MLVGGATNLAPTMGRVVHEKYVDDYRGPPVRACLCQICAGQGYSSPVQSLLEPNTSSGITERNGGNKAKTTDNCLIHDSVN